MPTTPLHYWVDYDRPQLPLLTLNERIDYFEKRVRMVLVNPLIRMVKNNEIAGQPDSSALLILAVSLCCGIEATGKFLSGGRGGNRDRFEAFVRRYMSGEFYTGSLNGMNYAEIFWKNFRNGLAHGFTVTHGGFEGQPGLFMIQRHPGYDVLEVNPNLFLADFEVGFSKYLSDLRAATAGEAILNDFDSVFTDVFINGN
jgi:hypothetical protein